MYAKEQFNILYKEDGKYYVSQYQRVDSKSVDWYLRQ